MEKVVVPAHTTAGTHVAKSHRRVCCTCCVSSSSPSSSSAVNLVFCECVQRDYANRVRPAEWQKDTSAHRLELSREGALNPDRPSGVDVARASMSSTPSSSPSNAAVQPRPHLSLSLVPIHILKSNKNVNNDSNPTQATLARARTLTDVGPDKHGTHNCVHVCACVCRCRL